MLAVFVLAQALDAALTYVGITTFGTSIEANPVVAWWVSALGAGAGLAAVKTLYVTACHRILGGLTVLYLAGAVLPWTRLLWL